MEDKRSSNKDNVAKLANPGPYLARVINNIDPMRQGSLEVELLRNVGNQVAANQQTFTVRYLSPFYGCTDIELTGSDGNDFNHTQKSYGFWAVPPDTGTIVMVIFVEGDAGQGFWMGCVQDTYMNHMIPGIAATNAVEDQTQDQDSTTWKDNKNTQELYGTGFLPAGEFNRTALRKGNTTVNPAIDNIKKPVHPMANVLLGQGLVSDTSRGTHTSSARRESPSAVFGISTPGPVDKRNKAQKGNIGRALNKINTFISRLGGHTLVMDDGNDRMLRKSKPWEGPDEYANVEEKETDGLINFPEDESFRIRTRTGHQILLHNSEDLIYIGNSRGTAWIELTSCGKIDIYCQDSISVRSEQDFNFTAERDFNVHAGRSINFHSGSTFNVQSVNDVNVKSGTNIHISADTDLSIKSNNRVYVDGDHGLDLKTNNLKITSTGTEFLTSGNMHLTTTGTAEFKSGVSTLITAGSNIYTLAGKGMFMQQNTFDTHTQGLEKHYAGGGIHLLTDAGVFIQAEGNADIKIQGRTALQSTGEICIKSDGKVSIQSGAKMNLKSGAAASFESSGKMNIKGSNVAVQGSGKISLNGGGEIRIEGSATYLQSGGADSADAADAACTANAAEKAATSLQAAEATSASGTGPAKELTLYPLPGVGQVLSKRAPTIEPYEHHENRNPAGFTPELTDREAADMPFSKDGPRLTIRRTADGDTVDAEFGGGGGWGGGPSSGAGGGSAYAGKQAMTNPDSSTSYEGRPPTASQLASWPSDWTKDTDFLSKAQKLAGKYGLPLEHFLAFMHFETAHTMRPDKGNGLGYYGLIQFGPAAAKSLGTDTGTLRQMSRAEQLDWVEKYFDMWIKKMGARTPLTIEKMYLLVALPAYVNRGDNEILAAQNGPNRVIWQRNPGWRSANNGPITPASIGNAPKRCIPHVEAQLGRSKNNTGGL